MASRMIRQLGRLMGRVPQSATTSPAVQGIQQECRDFLRLSLGVAAAAAATAISPPVHCIGRTEAPPATVPDLSAAGIPLRGSQTPPVRHRSIVFVLGGPGSGKGTQCSKLVEEFGVVHLSAGDLLRAHMKSGSPDGNMVAEMIKDGKIVPSHVTNGLLEGAMNSEQDTTGKNKFLIDGFPRNDENRAAFEEDTGEQPAFILFFNCPQEIMEKRLLGRNEGRTDDNIETIRKRFSVFISSSLPVIEHYRGLDKVREIKADRPAADVYQDVRQYFIEL